MGQSFTNNPDNLIVFTKVKVTQFRGELGLSSSFNTQQIQNIKEISSLPRIAQLINWKKPGGNSFNVSQPPQQNESGLSTLAKVCQEMNYAHDKAFFDVRARVVDIKIDGAQPYYPCCGVSKECQKKAIEVGQSKKNIFEKFYI